MGLGRDENIKGGVWWGWEEMRIERRGLVGLGRDENREGGVWWGWEGMRI